MKELYICEMTMAACGIKAGPFAHRRAWIYLEVMLFWMNLLAMIVMLITKMRILGGGIELFSWIMRIVAHCKGDGKKEEEEENENLVELAELQNTGIQNEEEKEGGEL